MTKRNKIYLISSILTFLLVLIGILKNFDTILLFGNPIEPIWLVIWFFVLILPIVNLAEIINNRDDWSLYYWIGLGFNIISIVFIIRHYKIDLF